MAAPRKRYTVSTPHGLYVRESPSYSAAILRTLTNGENVTADGKEDNGWIPIKGGGFVAAKYLK